MGDWIDVAWGRMLEQAPMMSDPGRWQTLMYEAFWLGKEPELTAEERKAQDRSRKEAGGKGLRGANRSQIAAMEELLAQAAAMREQASAEK